MESSGLFAKKTLQSFREFDQAGLLCFSEIRSWPLLRESEQQTDAKL
jgi:hypothetical protein